MTAPNTISILCVDDEEPNLFLFKLIFEKKYQVITATSGIDALEKLENSYRDIVAVFSDMKMPNMSGIEFIKKAREKYTDIGYFILSGYNSNEEIQEAVEKKIIRKFFTKPFDTSEIESCIEDFRNQKEARM